MNRNMRVAERARANFYRCVSEVRGGVVFEQRWLGSGKPHLCLCAKGHECRPTPSNAQRQGICLVCAGKDPNTARENFYRQVTGRWRGVVLEQRWLGKDRPHLCLCASGHECRPRPGDVRRGRGICRICAGDHPVTARENFCRWVAEEGGVVLEQRWLGADTPHLCLCAKGHECRVISRGSRQGGNGICRVCAGNDPATARENFYRRAVEESVVVLEQRWLGSVNPHRCLCDKGHECSPMPANIQQGHQGFCWECSWSAQTVVYVVRDPVKFWVKSGITSWDGYSRLSSHRKDGFTEVLYSKTSLPEGLAAHTEQKIKAALSMAGAKPVRGREYFSDDYTALVLNEIGNWILRLPAK